MIGRRQVLFLSILLVVWWAGNAHGHEPSRHGPAAPATTSSGPAVTVELQAKVQGDLPWRFWPDRRVIRARRGESVQVLYRARNLGERQITGKAIHSIMPDGAEEHLSLIECFCFVQATLEPGEERVFPLAFQLRPTLPRTVRRVVIRYEFAAEPSGGPVAGPAVPPSPGTLEVWAKARRAEGSEGNPVGLRAVSVGIEGQASPGVAGWFQLPALAHGVRLDGDGGPHRLLQSAVPAG
ncbi:MAG: cytochrome c oxidase assembly protein, partial [candidate division NC10 bacterium]